MKTKLNRALPLVAFTCLSAMASSLAQTPPPLGNPAPQPAIAEIVPAKKLNRFEASGLYLRAAVAKLQESLSEEGMPAINVLFDADTEKMEITSQVVLHNVTGPDALQLIATAAGCTIEPMLSTEDSPSSTVSRLGSRRPPVAGYVIRNAAASGPRNSARSSAMVAVAGKIEAAPAKVTRVYALGTVTSYSKFPDIEKALRDVLNTDGVPSGAVTLAVHDKINLLVVNAPESVHVMVDQFLNALSRNAQEADRQNGAREVAQMRLEVEMAARAKAMLERELTEKEAHVRALQKELMALQGQKKP